MKHRANRIAVYFFFDKDGIIRDYNLFFIKSLKEIAQKVVVVSNGELTKESLQKVKNLSVDTYIRENKGFDVWAYKETMEYIGWSNITKYNELILCNFTCYGPIYPFSEMFNEMDKRGCDFWGAAKHPEQKNYLLPNNKGWIHEHIMSYFMVIRHNMLISPYFKEYWDNIPQINTKTESTAYHETVFTKYFEELGFTSDAFVDLKKYEGRANNGSIFYANEFLIKDRCPLVKRRAFFFPLYDNILDYSDGHQANELLDFITHQTNYDEAMIWDDILATQPMSTIMNNLQLNYMVSNQPTGASVSLNETLFIFSIRYKFQIEYLKKYLEKSDIKFAYIVSYNEKYNDFVREILTNIKEFKFKLINGVADKNILEQIKLTPKIYSNYKTFCCIDSKDMKNPLLISYEDCYQYMCETLLGNKWQIENIISKFLTNKRLGMLIPYPVSYGNYETYANSLLRYNKDAWPTIYKNLNLNVPYDEKLNIIYENCFWGRIELLNEFVKTNQSVFPSFYPLLTQNNGFYCSYVTSPYSALIALNNALYRKHQIENIIFSKQQNNAWQGRALINKIAAKTEIKTIVATAATNSVLHFRDVKRTIKEYIKQKRQRKKQKRNSNKSKCLGNITLRYASTQEGRVILHILGGTDNIYAQCGIYKYYPKKEISLSIKQLYEYYQNYNTKAVLIELPLEKIKNHPIEIRRSEKEYFSAVWTGCISYGAFDFKKIGFFIRLHEGKIYIEDKFHFYKNVLFNFQYRIKEKLLFLLLKLNPIHKYILFAENGGAGDNSFELFKYAVKKNPNCYYLASKTVIAGIKDPLLKKHMVKFNSHRHIWMFFCSHKWIGSYSLRYELFPQKSFIKDILLYNIPAEWIFVPHGITADKVSILVHKYSWDEPSFTYCSSEYEKEYFSKNYEMHNVLALGYPRMDKWYDAKLDDKKIVLFFTWRIALSLMQKGNLFQTPYVKYIIYLVKFIQTKFPQKHIYYVFHHEVVKAGLDEIIKKELGDKNISYIYLNTTEGIQEFNSQFKTAKYLITDYSSVAYDFAYKKGSIPIYYLNEDFISGHYPLEQKFYDIHLGVLTKTLPELGKALKLNAPTAEMKKRKNKFFKYQDNKNCERVYNAIFLEEK